MKKIFLAIALLGFVAANAQTASTTTASADKKETKACCKKGDKKDCKKGGKSCDASKEKKATK